jgi:hypothetical protein
MDYLSSCSCASIQVELSLPNPIESYQPRECDCEFCEAHGLAYISDKLGTLTIKSSASINILKQGSKQASFVQCSHCEQVVAVTYRAKQVIKGAVSVALFAKDYALGQYQSVSPKVLSANDKRERWSTLWLTVVLDIDSNT